MIILIGTFHFFHDFHKGTCYICITISIINDRRVLPVFSLKRARSLYRDESVISSAPLIGKRFSFRDDNDAD